MSSTTEIGEGLRFYNVMLNDIVKWTECHVLNLQTPQVIYKFLHIILYDIHIFKLLKTFDFTTLC